MRSILAFSCAVFSASIHAATFSVTNNLESGPGSLVAAIDSANAAVGTGHNIVFTPNVGLIDLLAPLPIITKQNLVIDASMSPSVEIAPINPSVGFRLFRVGNTVDNLTLRGFSFRFGTAENTGEGGGCLDGANANATAVLTLDRMQFSQCLSRFSGFSRGGAVHWNGASVSAIDSIFDTNSALITGTGSFSQAVGGAIYGKTLNLTRARFVNNASLGRRGAGGGAHALNGVTVLDTVWLDNRASDQGGALSLDCAVQCLYDLRRGFFGRNQASQAGAINVQSAQLLSVLALQTISFVDNRAIGTTTTVSGAVFISQIVLEARHVSFQVNTGPTAHIGAQNGSQLRLVANSVFGRSQTPGCFFPNVAQGSGGNITTDVNCAIAFTGSTPSITLTDAPVEFQAAMPVVAYGPNSPVIDQANPAECLATDARGISRPQDGNADGTAVCDIGAYDLVNLIFRSGFEG